MHLGSHSAIKAVMGRRRGRCRWLLHLLHAPGVGDNALTGLLNIQTHLELTSQSQRQHHPHRHQLPCCCPMAESKPQTLQAWEELKARDTLYC